MSRTQSKWPAAALFCAVLGSSVVCACAAGGSDGDATSKRASMPAAAETASAGKPTSAPSVTPSGHPESFPLQPGTTSVADPVSAAFALGQPGTTVTIHSQAEANARRQRLIQYLWGTGGFPSTLPSSVEKGVPSPVSGLTNLARVDTLHFQMDQGVETFAYHFIPVEQKQTRLVIVHQGHSDVLNDDPSLADVPYGMQRTINNLLTEGYAVLAMFMPGCLPPNGCNIPHAQIVQTPTVGSGMKFFLEPVARALNYLQTQPVAGDFASYTDFEMLGLSGGGWTTTVYAALDPRITISIPIAGSLPIPLRANTALGDLEQLQTDFYAIAGYPDLYLLGALGANRAQVQVLNRHDDCCFGASPTQYSDRGTGLSFDDAVRFYESDVRAALEQIGSGSFRLEIDEAAPAHMISWNTVGSIVLPELRGSQRGAPMPGAETFARSARGTLVHEIAGQTEDTGIAVVGVPAWKSTSNGDYDVFARNPSNRLIHASKRGSAWTVTSFGTVIMTDPALVGSSSARLDATAVTTDYLPHHWWSDSASWSTEVVSNAPKALGSPNLAEHVAGQLDLFLRDWTHAPVQLRSDGADGWTALPPKTGGTP